MLTCCPPARATLTSTMMLRHLGLDSHANQIADSVYKVIQEGKVRTADMGGKAKTHDFTQAVMANF